jgi:hypothetical protein
MDSLMGSSAGLQAWPLALENDFHALKSLKQRIKINKKVRHQASHPTGTALFWKM